MVPAVFAASAIAPDAAGSPARTANFRGQPLRRELVLHDPDRPARLFEHTGIGELVLIDRARQRHQNRAAVRSADSSAMVEAPERDTTRCAAAMRTGRSGEERRAGGGHAELGVVRRDRVDVLGARLLNDVQPGEQMPVPSSATAAGTMSDITRAPWLPPNTRKADRAIGLRTPT